LEELWTNYPLTQIDGLTKWYYLVQFAFWLQQIVVVNIEERRKDYHQMLTHHLITCVLMYASYCYHMTRVGVFILVMMDFVDILLPVSVKVSLLSIAKTDMIIAGKGFEISSLHHTLRLRFRRFPYHVGHHETFCVFPPAVVD
jgi:hypothetical protein